MLPSRTIMTGTATLRLLGDWAPPPFDPTAIEAVAQVAQVAEVAEDGMAVPLVP